MIQIIVAVAAAGKTEEKRVSRQLFAFSLTNAENCPWKIGAAATAQMPSLFKTGLPHNFQSCNFHFLWPFVLELFCLFIFCFSVESVCNAC